MWFEDLLILILIGVGVFFIGIPLIKLVKYLNPTRSNPVKDAQAELEKARAELEVAKIKKEAEKVYSELYEEVIFDDKDKERKI